MRGRKRREHKFMTPDLWKEILLRSPVKTLLRFRCVCKTWCSFIDSPDFISTHLKIYKRNCFNTYLLAAEKETCSIFDPKFTIRRSDTLRKTAELVNLIKSGLFIESVMIDGLLLIKDYTLLSSNQVELYLWNPCIRKSVLFPRCPLNTKTEDYRRFHLGFDPSSNDYKVVGFEFVDILPSENTIAIAMYSLRDHRWRVKPTWMNVPRQYSNLICSRDGVVFSQGTLFWKPSQKFREEETRLLSFDFDSEEFSFTKMPDMEEEMLRYCFLLSGSVAVLGITRVRACVWVLEKSLGKDSWRQFSSGDSDLNAYKFFAPNIVQDSNIKIVYIENSTTLLVHKYNKLMSYNITSHQVEKIRKSFRCSNLDTYVESLVLHKGYEGASLTSLT